MDNNLIHLIDKDVFFYLFDDTPLPSTHNFIQAIAFLAFDELVGQITEKIFPPHLFSLLTLKHIASLGFPETNILSGEGCILYVFNIRVEHQKSLKCTNIQDQEFSYCYTYFFQKKTPFINRGYLQKSVVILSKYYRPKLFFPLVKLLQLSLIENFFKPLSDEKIQSFLKDAESTLSVNINNNLFSVYIYVIS